MEIADTRVSSWRVIIRSSVCPATWVAVLTCCCSENILQISMKSLANVSLALSMWILKSPQTTKRSHCMIMFSANSVNSSINMFFEDEGGLYTTTRAVGTGFEGIEILQYSNDVYDLPVRIVVISADLATIATPPPLPSLRGLECTT